MAIGALALLALTGPSTALAWDAHPSPRRLPAASKYNTTPKCRVTRRVPVCIWPHNPPADSRDPEYWGPSTYSENCAYWTAEKRPDIEQHAIQVYGYHRSPGGAWNWVPDARRAGYPVNHSPHAGAVVVWPDHATTALAGGGSFRASPGGHVAYVQRVFSDESFIASSMGIAGARTGATAWYASSADHGVYFIHLKRRHRHRR